MVQTEIREIKYLLEGSIEVGLNLIYFIQLLTGCPQRGPLLCWKDLLSATGVASWLPYAMLYLSKAAFHAPKDPAHPWTLNLWADEWPSLLRDKPFSVSLY